MNTTHHIWIPSKQQYVGFAKLTTTHQINLARSIEIDRTNSRLDFEESFAQLVTKLSQGNVDGSQINLYDKTAIALQLAIMHVGDRHSIHYNCQSCSELQQTSVVTTLNYTLSDILVKLQPIIDSSPAVSISSGDGIVINLDVLPAGGQIALERFQANQKDATNVGMLSWATSVVVKDTVFRLDQLEYEQHAKLFDLMPLSLLKQVREYIEKHKEICVPLFPLKCINCGQSNDVDFTLSSAHPIICNALKLDLDTIYRDIYILSSQHTQNVYDLTPIERDVFKKIHQENQPKG